MKSDSQYPPVADELVIHDLAGLKAIASPIRMQLIFRFRAPASVAEVAEVMGVPATRLYYHVNALAGAGILEVLETRKKGTQLEKIYRVAGTTIRPGPDVFTQAGGPRESAEAAATLVLDTTRVELVEALTRHAENGFEPDQRPGAIGRSLASLPAHLIPKFVDRLNALVHDLANSETDDGIPVTFTYVLLPGTSDNTELKKENES